MSSESFAHKVTADHLRRDAYLYVRQSSLRQVMENTESTQRQYALRDRAVALGWPLERVHTIDNDLGLSGAAAQNRDGFQHLVSQVAMGRAGIVLGLEVSRLARNNADWHRLLELAALSQTLILDEDGTYDPAHFNDRLLLGLKGAMSEAELHILKARLQGGMRNKASRGELEIPLPVGLVYALNGTVVLDPDARIRGALEFLFDTYRQTGAASAVVRRFGRENVSFPRRLQRGLGKGDVLWGPIDHRRVTEVLHNPRYAGAFVYGRRKTSYDTELRSHLLEVPREHWHTLIRDAHPGYITWDEFERNQDTLRRNSVSFGIAARGSQAREGVGLLQGRVLCGRCGARMRTRYQQAASGPVANYQCLEASVRRAAKACQSFQGRGLDAAIMRCCWTRSPRPRWRSPCRSTMRLRRASSKPMHCAASNSRVRATTPTWPAGGTSRSTLTTAWWPTHWRQTGTTVCVRSPPCSKAMTCSVMPMRRRLTLRHARQ